MNEKEEKLFDEEFFNYYITDKMLNDKLKNWITEHDQREKERLIKILEKVENEKWKDAEHCSCLAVAIEKIKKEFTK